MFRITKYFPLVLVFLWSCNTKGVEKTEEVINEFNRVKIKLPAGSTPAGLFFWPEGAPSRYEFAPLPFHFGEMIEMKSDSVGLAFLSNQGGIKSYPCRIIGSIDFTVLNKNRKLYVAIPLETELQTVKSESVMLFAIEHDRYFHILKTWLENYAGLNQSRIIQYRD